jgi:predicted nuclease with TOPRIM domain
MNKTRVDDMLIEMIGPKVKEIEEKFGNNQSLSQEDINTLLLKSQYNHINHLDDKLNEVTAYVASLKGDFKDLEHKFDRLEDKFDKLEVSLDNKIEKALNRNLKQTFFAIGGFFILIKGFEYLDLLIK